MRGPGHDQAQPTGRSGASAVLSTYAENGSLAEVANPIDRFVAIRLDDGGGTADLIDELLTLLSEKEDFRGMLPVIRHIVAEFEHGKDDRTREIAAGEERQRLGRELHDSMVQSVYGLGLLADAATMLLDQGNVDLVKTKLQGISDSAREILGEIRVQVFELQPSALESEGLAGVIGTRLAAVESRTGLITSLDVVGEHRPHPDVEVELLGIAQELLNNSLKHSNALRVIVTLHQTETSVYLQVADDGDGFVLSEGRAKGGLGLAGIVERSRLLGTRTSFDTAPGCGTRASVLVRLDSAIRAKTGTGR